MTSKERRLLHIQDQVREYVSCLLKGRKLSYTTKELIQYHCLNLPHQTILDLLPEVSYSRSRKVKCVEKEVIDSAKDLYFELLTTHNL